MRVAINTHRTKTQPTSTAPARRRARVGSLPGVLLKRCAIAVVCGGALLGTADLAPASELVYRPINPSFGGNPFNSAHLLGIANAQNKFEDPDSDFGGFSGLSDADLFVSSLQNQLLGALAGQVSDAIFGPDPQDSGTIVFGSQTITFNRGLEFIAIQIFDAATGETTQIQVPVLTP